MPIPYLSMRKSVTERPCVITFAQGGTPVFVSAHADWKREPIEADLTKWAGRRVSIYLVSDCGPKGNTSGDWCNWSDLKITTR